MIDAPTLEIIDLGVLGYDECLKVQHATVRERIAHEIPDRLLRVPNG